MAHIAFQVSDLAKARAFYGGTPSGSCSTCPARAWAPARGRGFDPDGNRTELMEPFTMR